MLAGVLAGFYAYGSSNFLLYEVYSIGLFVFFLLDFIDSIGKSFNPFNITILLAVFQCLLMPIIVYHVYNTDAIVIALKYDMGVSQERYYGFVFPAIVLLIAGLKLPLLLTKNYNDRLKFAVTRAALHLKGKGNIGVLLMIIGFVSGFMQIFLPGELRYVAYLFGKLLYVGAIYTYFSDHKSRKLYLGIALVAILGQSLAQGMFGELVYTTLLGAMLLLLGKHIPNKTKYGLATFGFIAIMLLQSIKVDYRAVVWRGQGDQSKGNFGTFVSLISDRITDPSRFFDWATLFPTVNRFNQGMIIGKVMDHVPARAPYAEGETIFTSLAASFVPRLLWPNKPQSGGHWNMERFTGFIITGYSMNVSPLGEAYGNFGVEGGIAFMFFYGLFFSVMILLLLHLMRTTPTIILWFPILFLNSVQIETDVLMCVNSFIKNSIFIWICYWGFNRFLRLKL